jgi:hypothetical protein
MFNFKIKKMNDNKFKLGLYSGNTVVCETIFDADSYNPYVRYSVDIRNELNKILKDFKYLLSDKNSSNRLNTYLKTDTLKYFKSELNKYDSTIKNYYVYRPTKNIEMKFGLYINDNTVVERLFNVSKLDYDAFQSFDIVIYLNNIKLMIEEKLREKDINLMWEDYDLINTYNMNIQQIRDMDERKRKSLLYKIYSN